jgi:hypothetical protein
MGTDPSLTERLCEAARARNLVEVSRLLAAGADVHATNGYGFTALESAAMGTSTRDTQDILAVMRLLVSAGSPLEHRSNDGRTALYLAAEFSWTTEPVALLLDAGANGDVTSGHGVHVLVNAMTEDVKKLLAARTGRPLPPARIVERAGKKPTADAWRDAENRVGAVFDALSSSGLVVARRVGFTQEDGFAACEEIWHRRGGAKAGLVGFCFYTEQDDARAKSTGILPIAFWGAPEGADADMIAVGKRIVDALRGAGLDVEWDGTAKRRPSVYIASADDDPPVRRTLSRSSKLTEADRPLIDGSDDDIDAFLDAQAVIVDWRGEFDEIVAAFAAALPPDYLAMEVAEDEEVMVSSPHAVATVPLDGEPPWGLDLAAAIAVILPPDFEAHAFRHTLESDTHCYLVRPRAWWDAFRAKHAKRFREIFAEPEELPERFEVEEGE